ncbi:MAG: asparaginase [Thermomicrobiales bacterium]
MTTALLEVWRGPVVECRHYGAVVVADARGGLIARAGSPELPTYLRSAAKPFQALPIITSGAAEAFDLTSEELAICASSHSGEPVHLAVVGGLLAKLGLDETALQCGAVPPIDREVAAQVEMGALAPSALYCDCSGKHAGMLAVCRHRGEPLESYRDPAHPHQQEIARVMSDFLGLPERAIPRGIDGCGVPTFAAPLARIAAAWAGLAAPRPGPYRAAATRVLDAMAAHPYLVGGRGRVDTDLMECTGGAVVAKAGAEGVLCLALRERGWGVAIKVEDGSFRGMAAIAAQTLRQLHLLDDTAIACLLERQPLTVRNNTGVVVGEVRPAFSLR